MTRFFKILIPFLMLFLSLPALGQNNPYDLTDDCYQLFLKADSMVGKEGFASINEELLQAAVRNSDDKARVLYYVLDLRALTRKPETTDEQVLAAHERLKEIALKLGYRQYFYQSYESTKNYFFNTGRLLKAVELIREMQREAVARDDQYGKWSSAKAFATIYGNYGDRNTQRRYLAEVIDTYNSSDDPLIKRQTIAPAYLDYANTFPPRSDSLRYFVRKAWSLAKTPQDSVRCAFEFANIGALAVNYQEYAKWRDMYDQSPFRTDPRRVQQILINLLTNACKHTASGEIRVGYSLTENPGEVTFYVEDTGPGVPADQAERIFERFTKLDEFVQGTGLGLSICREIADKMGGRVFLDTSYTGGARFVFVLPETPAQPVA